MSEVRRRSACPGRYVARFHAYLCQAGLPVSRGRRRLEQFQKFIHAQSGWSSKARAMASFMFSRSSFDGLALRIASFELAGPRPRKTRPRLSRSRQRILGA